jgi:hypothetical protein
MGYLPAEQLIKQSSAVFDTAGMARVVFAVDGAGNRAVIFVANTGHMQAAAWLLGVLCWGQLCTVG